MYPSEPVKFNIFVKPRICLNWEKIN